VSGLLGGLVLLVVPGRRGWLLFGGLVAAEAGGWLLVGLPYDPPANALGWVLIAFTYQGLTVYGLTRLADLNDRLDATRTALAEVAVTRLRLVATERVNTVVLRRLDELTALAERALRAGSADDARHRLATAGQVARQASADARRLVEGLPEPRVHRPGGSAGSGAVTPALTRAVVTVVVAAFAGTYVLNIAFPISVPPHGWGVVTAAVVIAVVVAGLQWRHVSFGGAGRPAAWPWTLAAQTVLSVVLYPATGVASVGLLVLPGASCLLLIRHWSR
jgi:two-component system sensor histidine kinase DesK